MNRVIKFANFWTQQTCTATTRGHLRENHVLPRRRAHNDAGAANAKELKSKDKEADQPVKFSTSEAYVNYRASLNFYGDTRELPPSHNLVLASTFIFAGAYIIYLRDEKDDRGAMSFVQPLHETLPQRAIPLLKTAIAENRKFGNNTTKLEAKLAEYMKDPKKYGGE